MAQGDAGQPPAPPAAEWRAFAQSSLTGEGVNIAVGNMGTVAIASDRRAMREHLADEAMIVAGLPPEVQANRFWEAEPRGGEKWLVFDWRFPRPIHELAFDVPTPDLVQQFHVDVWDLERAEWRPLYAGQLTEIGQACVGIENVVTSKVRLRLTVDEPNPEAQQAPGALRIGSVRVISHMTMPEPPGWTGQWIWAPADPRDPLKHPSSAWVRKTFTVENIETVGKAWAQIAVDDVAVLYVNDKRVGVASVRSPMAFNITPYLRQGENVVVAAVVDRGGAYGVMAELVLNHHRNGKIEAEWIPTDETWQATLRSPFGSEASEAGGSVWAPAVVRYDSPSGGPWGQIVYQSLAFNPDLIRVDSTGWDGRRIQPGAWMEGAVRLSSPAELSEDYALLVEMEVPYPDSTSSDLRVARQIVWPQVPTSQWMPGQWYDVPVRVWAGPFAPHGAVTMKVTAVGGGKYARLQREGAETADRNVIELAQLHVQRLDRQPDFSAFSEPAIRLHGDTPVLFIDDQPYPPIILTKFDIGLRTLHQYTKTDLHLYRIAALGNAITTPERADAVFAQSMERLDAEADLIFRYDPDARLILNVMVRTDQTWVDRYPEELFVTGKGERSHAHSPASDQWQQDGAALIQRLVRHVESQPYGRRVIGYAFMAGGGGEYHHYGPAMGMVGRDEAFIGDFSPPAIRSFRRWLEEKYRHDVEALRRAWGDPQVTFETAQPINAHLVAEAELGFLRDPDRARDAMDYFQWYSQRNGQNLVAFCEAAKSASRGNPLCGGPYGYAIKMQTQTPGENQGEGHGAFTQVIDSPAVDFIILPYTYDNRQGGKAFAHNGLPQSLMARGKLYIGEYDNRTFASGLTDYPQRSLRESIAIQRRDIGASLATGVGWWWLDFVRGEQGQPSVPWFDHPALIRDMRRAKELYQWQLQRPMRNTTQIAVFADFDSSFHLDIYASIPGYNAIGRTLMHEVPAIGAPADVFALQDIAIPWVQEHYKMYVFLNAYHLTEQQRRIITGKLQRQGKTLVWLWGAGLYDDDSLDPANMQEITGMHFGMDPEWQSAVIRLNAGSPLSAGIPAGSTLQMADWHISYFRNRAFYEKRLAPVLWPTDDDLSIAGRFAFNDQPGLAVKQFDAWTSVYCGVPYVSAEVLRNIARQAGVHLYFDSPIASLHANDRFVSIHNRADKTTQGTLMLPEQAKVVDAFSGEPLTDGPVRHMDLVLEPGQTKVLMLLRENESFGDAG